MMKATGSGPEGIASNPILLGHLRRWMRVAAIAVLLGSLAAAIVSFFLPWAALRFVVFFLALIPLITALLGSMLKIGIVCVPKAILRKTAVSASLIVGILVQLVDLSSLNLIVLFAYGIGIPLCYAVAFFFRYMQLVLLPRELRKRFERAEFLEGAEGFIYVHASDAAARWYVMQVVGRLRSSLIAEGNLCFPLFSFSVGDQPFDFRHWICGQVPIIVVCGQLANLETDEELGEILSVARCRVYVLDVSGGREFEKPNRLQVGVTGVEILALPQQNAYEEETYLAEAAFKLQSVYRSSGLPLFSHESSLPTDLRCTSIRLGSEGLSPLADCYLRFRTSEGHVERFFALLDCVEVLVKMSVSYLLVQAWRETCAPTGDEGDLDRPTLGHWIQILRRLIQSPVGDETACELAEAWSRPTIMPPEVIGDSLGDGLPWRGKVPRSYIGWLDWFAWLRNVTRGHGVVDADSAQLLWANLHETFLRLVARQEALVFGTAMFVTVSWRSWEMVEGWRRIKSRVLREAGEAGYLEVVGWGRKDADGLYLAYPLIVLDSSGSFLTWNRVRGTSVEFIDYGGGEVSVLGLGKIGSFALWAEKRQEWQREHPAAFGDYAPRPTQ